MTTNEIVVLARHTLLKLGYKPEVTRTDTTPALDGPINLKDGGHIPYCKVAWQPVEDQNSEGYSRVQMDINTENKSVVGLYLGFARTYKVGTPLKVDVEPELESNYRKRVKGTIFVRTNAPPRIPLNKPPGTN